MLIEGRGRTGFQNGDTDALYRSAREKQRNPRLGLDGSQEEFRGIMGKLHPPYPKFIGHAVPGKRLCGVCPGHLPEDLEKFRKEMTQSPQG